HTKYATGVWGGGLEGAVPIPLFLLAGSLPPPKRPAPRLRVTPKKPPIARDPTNARYVTVDELNLREGPSNRFAVSYILPRGTWVILLGEAHRDLDGNVWLRVIVETLEGRQTGWVDERYVS